MSSSDRGMGVIRVLLWGGWLLAFLGGMGAAYAARQVRASPVLKADKEYNIILLHVAEHFVLTIPDGYSEDQIRYNVSCSFTIAEDGSIRGLRIDNQVDVWVQTFERKEEVDLWLRAAILQGMAGVPRFTRGQLKEIKSKRKRTVVFTFREQAAGHSAHIPHMGDNQPQVNANLDASVADQLARMRRMGTEAELPGDREHPVQPDDKQLNFNIQSAWERYTAEHSTQSMQEYLRPNLQNTPAPLIEQPLVKPEDRPRTEVVITLQ